MAERTNQDGNSRQSAVILEWVAGAVGLVLTLGLIGFIGWEAFTRPERVLPQIEVSVEEVRSIGDGYIARIVARNASGQTAQAVEIEGALMQGGQEVEKSTVTLDYVPGGSEAHGGLYFSQDPSAGRLRLRPLGYARP